MTNIPGYGTDSVVQHILAFMLHFSSKVSIHDEAVHQGDWVNSKDFSFTLGTLNELSGSTLGIIGLGTIGRKLAKVADAMGMKIIAAHQSSMDRLELPFEVEWLPVDEVFARADFLVLELSTHTGDGQSGECRAIAKNEELGRSYKYWPGASGR